MIGRIHGQTGLLFCLVVGATFGAIHSAHGQVPKYGNFVDKISELEAQMNLAAEKRLLLARYGFYMAEMYDALHFCVSHVNYRRGQCELENNATSATPYMVGARAALELGWPDSALNLLSALPRRASGDHSALSLLNAVAVSEKSGSAIADIPTGSVSQKVEIQYHQFRQFGDIDQNTLSVDDIAGLSGQWSFIYDLMYSMEAEDLVELRKLVSSIDREGVTEIDASTSDGAAMLSNPALFRLLAQAHYQIAFHDFTEALPALQDRYVKSCLDEAARCALQLNTLAKMQDLSGKLEAFPELMPFRGWSYWKAGDKNQATDLWESCTDPQKWKAASNLLYVWSAMPQFRDQARELAKQCVSQLGDKQSQHRIRTTNPSRFLKTYVGLGRVLLKTATSNEDYETATQMIFLGSGQGSAITLAAFFPDYCALLFTSRTLSKKQYLLQEGFQGFLELQKYYPLAASVIDDLSLYQACLTKGTIEK